MMSGGRIKTWELCGNTFVYRRRNRTECPKCFPKVKLCAEPDCVNPVPSNLHTYCAACALKRKSERLSRRNVMARNKRWWSYKRPPENVPDDIEQRIARAKAEKRQEEQACEWDAG